MYRIIVITVLCSFLFSCKEKKTESVRITYVSGDTTFIVQPVQLYTNSIEFKKDTSFNINGNNYILNLSTKVDTTHKLYFIDTTKDDNSKKITISKRIGPLVDFKIDLLKNKKTLFHKTFNKDIFKSILKNNLELYTVSYSEPRFEGIISDNDKSIYTIDFAYPFSDVGLEYYFILDNKGNINNIGLLNTFNKGCDGQLSIQPNFILANYAIINNNGSTIDLTPKSDSSFLAGVKLINDSVVLAIYHLADKEAENAVLMKNDGSVIAKFNYKGFILEMSYHIPIVYISEIEKFVLLDEENQLIRVINKNDPIMAEVVRFNEMENQNENEENEEITFELSSLSNVYEMTYYTESKSFKMERK